MLCCVVLSIDWKAANIQDLGLLLLLFIFIAALLICLSGIFLRAGVSEAGVTGVELKLGRGGLDLGYKSRYGYLVQARG